MKKHWKKILLSILGLFVICSVIATISYMKKREENATKIMYVMNDPYLSHEEKAIKLQELSGGTKEYKELKKALKKNGFTITVTDPNELKAFYEEDDYKIGFQYEIYNNTKEVTIAFAYDNTTKIKVSKHKKIQDILKVLEIKKLNVDNKIKTLKTSDDEINLSLKNDWELSIVKIDGDDMGTLENMLFLTFEKELY